MTPYQTNFALGSIAPLTWAREQNPNGLPPVLTGGVLRLAVQTGAYQASSGSDAINDRCEMRDPEKLPMGTTVFYGFDMRVPADFPSVDARFVCAQLKASYDDSEGGSPLFALRIEQGRFMATVEISFEDGDEKTLVPADPSAPGRVLDHHDFADADQHQVRLAFATDVDGLPPGLVPSFAFTSTKAEVRLHNPMPLRDDQWHRWAIRLEPSAAPGYDALVQLWCDAKPIATAIGQFGSGKALQYFKLGAYRDKSPLWGTGAAALEFRDIRRGSALADVA